VLFVAVFLNADRITAPNFSLLQHPCKNAFPRHYAITGFVVNGAAVVALFADLGNFNQGMLPQSQAVAHRNVFPVTAGGGDVFGKIAESYLKAFFTGLIYFFGGQKTDLSMLGAGVGITLETMLLF